MEVLFISYEASQFWIKFVVTLVICGPVLLGLYKLWQKDVDVARFFNVKTTLEESADKAVSWIPGREADAIYQDGKLVAKTKNVTIDESLESIVFEQIFESNNLDLGKEFEFRKWVVKLIRIEEMIGLSSAEPQKGQILNGVTCSIVRTR